MLRFSQFLTRIHHYSAFNDDHISKCQSLIYFFFFELELNWKLADDRIDDIICYFFIRNRFNTRQVEMAHYVGDFIRVSSRNCAVVSKRGDWITAEGIWINN